MGSLKEIKERIGSVRSTRKITSAMKMVAAAKLHRAQREIGALVPYSDELQAIVAHLATGEGVGVVPLAEEREVKAATVVGFASSSTLCGAYNSNVGRKVVEHIAEEYGSLDAERLDVRVVGSRLGVELKRSNIHFAAASDDLSEKPDYTAYRTMAEEFMSAFLEGRTDRVELVYYKFISAGTQRLVCERLLPIELPTAAENSSSAGEDYILEPTRKELIDSIVPRQVALKLFTAALSAAASEHAARMMAMQSATDNADELIGTLSLEYNKQRQQAITTELLDMMGGRGGE